MKIYKHWATEKQKILINGTEQQSPVTAAQTFLLKMPEAKPKKKLKK